MDLKQMQYFLCLAQEGNVTRAAAIAEVSRQMIQKLMRKHAL